MARLPTRRRLSVPGPTRRTTASPAIDVFTCVRSEFRIHAPRIPLHAEVLAGDSLLVVALVAVGTLGAALLLGLAIAAVVRRRSRPYLLVAGAIAALLARSTVAGVWVADVWVADAHHLLEHVLDVIMVALVVAAVYYARTAPGEVSAER